MFLFIWASGKKHRIWKTPDNKYLVVSWNYFSIFWCPIIAYNIQWHLIECAVGDRIITSEKVGEIFPDQLPEGIYAHTIVGDRVIAYEKVGEIFPDQTPALSTWEKYGLVMAIIIVIICIVIISIVNALTYA
jgi:hypothetical protein